jgi:hypothetical protein
MPLRPARSDTGPPLALVSEDKAAADEVIARALRLLERMAREAEMHDVERLLGAAHLAALEHQDTRRGGNRGR